MAISEAYTGSVSISTTEISMTNGNSTIATVTTDGVYQAVVDVNALTAADVFEFRVREKARSSDTQRSVYLATIAGAQAYNFVSPAITLINGWDMTLKKISGTDRTITWSIRQLS